MLLSTYLLALWPLLALCCDEGWTPFEKHCYKTFSEPGIQNSNANDFCMRHGAFLSSVLTDSERQFLIDFTTTGECIDDKWQVQIGGYRESHLHPWKWYDGSPFTQLHYFTYPSEPTNKPGEFYLGFMGDRFSSNKPFGCFIDQALSPAYQFVCKKNDTGRPSTVCDEKWAAFGGNCYRRFSDPTMSDCTDINRYCNNFGASLASVITEEERLFIIDFARSGRQKLARYQPIIGGFRVTKNSPWQWYDGTPFTQHNMWAAKAPTNENRLCMRIKSDVPSYYALGGPGVRGYFFDIDGTWKAYQFICKKKGIVCDKESMELKGKTCVCKPNYIDIVDSNAPDANNYQRGQKCVACDSSMIIQNGRCVCKAGFIDIVDSNLPEASNYKRGQKCVKKGRCYSVKDTTTILFIFDSSESITVKHWPTMVQFVKEGATRMPNTFRVGFMKFSTKISGKKWLEPNWTEKEYYKAVPSKYDSGETDTPLALREAKKMFKNDRNKNKIAVLITDGMPFSMKYDSPELALNKTEKAARELRRAGIRLTVMGVGRDVRQSDVKEWLKNPRKDYLSFGDTVDCLKGKDMDNLLQIVCDCD